MTNLILDCAAIRLPTADNSTTPPPVERPLLVAQSKKITTEYLCRYRLPSFERQAGFEPVQLRCRICIYTPNPWKGRRGSRVYDLEY